MPPGISIIIAHRNASQKLRACVESLARSDYRPFEIIVVDDASDEDPRSALADLPVRWIPLTVRRGSGFARDKGAETAAYDILFFVDADTVMQADALQRVDLAIHAEQHDGVIGVVDGRPLNPGIVPEWTATETHFLGVQADNTPYQFFTALCGAIRADVYVRYGGLHHRHIDDFEFSSRLVGSTVRIKIDKELSFRHHYSHFADTCRKLFIRSFFFARLDNRPAAPWFTADRTRAAGLAAFAALVLPLAAFPAAAAAGLLAAAGFLFFSRALLLHHYRTRGTRFLLQSIGLKFAFSVAAAAGVAAGIGSRLLEETKSRLLRAAGPARIYLRLHSPTYAILYVTARCNSRCSYCFQWEILNEPARVKREMTLGEYVRLAQTMGPMEHITLGGGEPFLRKDLADIAAAFYRYTGVRNISIPTNGTRPDLIEAIGGEILRRCPKTTLKISLSIDGVGEEHDRLRGTIGNYERLIEADQVLRRLRARHSNLYYIINTCYNGRNQDTVLTTIQENSRRFDHDIQVSTFVRGSVANSTEKDVDINTYHDIVEYLEHVQTIERKGHAYLLDTMHQALQIESRASISTVLTEGKSDYLCTAGRNMVVIDDVGNVNPCEILPGKFSFGNLRDFDMNLPAMMQQAQVRETQRRIRDERCFCTWECAQLNSIVYSPVGLMRLARHMWALTRRRRVMKTLNAGRPQSASTVADFDVFQKTITRERIPLREEPVHWMVREGQPLNPFNIEHCADETGAVHVTPAMNDDELRRKRERWLRPVALSRRTDEEHQPVAK